jgi:hypothetical protein
MHVVMVREDFDTGDTELAIFMKSSGITNKIEPEFRRKIVAMKLPTKW